MEIQIVSNKSGEPAAVIVPWRCGVRHAIRAELRIPKNLKPLPYPAEFVSNHSPQGGLEGFLLPVYEAA